MRKVGVKQDMAGITQMSWYEDTETWSQCLGTSNIYPVLCIHEADTKLSDLFTYDMNDKKGKANKETEHPWEYLITSIIQVHNMVLSVQ